MKENNKLLLIFLIYLLSIALFTYFSRTISFHDTYEYVTLTKEFAGINNINVYTTHSLIFPFLAAQLLKIFPTLFTVKLLGSIWLFFTSLLIFLYSKNKKALYLSIFSPIAWIISIQYTPIIPATFFILLAYVLFKKFEETNSKTNFVISGLSSGLAITFYYPSVIPIFFFIFTFMFNKKFYIPFLYSILILLALIPELILNYIFFNLPFYSIIRYFGINTLVLLGKSFKLNFIYSYWLLIPVAVTPFLFKILKLDFKKFNRELIFIVLCSLFFAIRGADIKYFYLFSPIIILLVSQCLSKNELYINNLISILIILLLTSTYFGTTIDIKIINDLNMIKKEYPVNQYLTSDNRANMFATFSWNDSPKFIWLWEYELQQKKEDITSNYEIKSNPKIKSDKVLSIDLKLLKANTINFNKDIYLIAKNGDAIPNGFELMKVYNILSVYKKTN